MQIITIVSYGAGFTVAGKVDYPGSLSCGGGSPSTHLGPGSSHRIHQHGLALTTTLPSSMMGRIAHGVGGAAECETKIDTDLLWPILNDIAARRTVPPDACNR